MPRPILPVVLAALVLAPGCALQPQSYWVPDTVIVERVDYTGWDGLLRETVRGGQVDYAAISRDGRLGDFVDVVRRSRFTKETTRDQRLAFLINGYNALIISAILDGGSPASLGGRYQFFTRKRYGIAGESITLLDLERERILKYGEPRVHFALVCASASCPKLRAEAYRPERLDAQLEEDARGFVNDPTRNHFDPATRTASVSKIFKWYEKDFTTAHGSVQAYLSGYVVDPDVARGLASGGWKLRFLSYDWSLNGAPPHAAEL